MSKQLLRIKRRDEQGDLHSVRGVPEFGELHRAVKQCKSLCAMYAFTDYVVVGEMDDIVYQPTKSHMGEFMGVIVRHIDE